MKKPYNHHEIEQKWQATWSRDEVYRTKEAKGREKAYVLDMFPYPSGEGLHVGHPKGYIATDIFSRFARMNGKEVLHPMGWDAFGLPAENYAIKNKVHPGEAVRKNIARYKEQLSLLGFDYDWSREINTTDPEYYRWTQWIFLRMWQKGLAYESYEPINWCPSCKTGLANEDLEDGKCERCGSEVEQKPLRQWVLKITDYAKRLVDDLSLLDWPEHIKESQRNWIYEKDGAMRLKDWVFSRQRYWGEPIPLIHCQKCGVVGVPEADLPVRLPEVDSYEPTGTGESPLASIESWVNVSCPMCGGEGKRETNTMPQWAGSCWYYLRYMDPKNEQAFASKESESYWHPVDMYVGGAEHATRHLIYARFWHKFLCDIGVVSTNEPFQKLASVGLILAEDGRKMSKRWGNVINPDDIVERFGADSLRMYEMFMGPFDQAIAWNTDGLVGVRRFLERVWRLSDLVVAGEGRDEMLALSRIHETIPAIAKQIVEFRFNTAISHLMVLTTDLEKIGSVSRTVYEALLCMLAPFAPHIAEELWHDLGNTTSIHLAKWPEYSPDKVLAKQLELPVQVNGKIRGILAVDAGISQAEALAMAEKNPTIKGFLANGIVSVTFVPDRILSIVARKLD